jgi:(1->4)-alpha-D-glucan 1-alpha-D-glucosylmutase
VTRPPRATYRLQLGPSFRFADAAAAVPYLAALGVSHLYLSPVLQAAKGSTHGYDVIDPDQVSTELGGEAAFRTLVATAHAAGLGILLDIVPNHMAIDLPSAPPSAGAGNRWWLDVLENGPSSYHAHYFDVEWTGDDRVLLPMLGERYGRALASGHFVVTEALTLRVGDRELPLSPRSIGDLVRRAAERIGHAELAFVGDALVELPRPSHRGEVAERRRRHRDKAVLLARLAELRRDPAVAVAISEVLRAVASHPAELDALLEEQNYRLAHWSVVRSQLGYRRFFDINSLVGIRNEDPEVFAASHARIAEWLADGTIDGVRIDHIDGLCGPGAYLQRLRALAPEDTWIVVEKILADGEDLPAGWPVDGTTGYDFLSTMSALLIDPDGAARLAAIFAEYTGEPVDVAAARRRARLEVTSDALHGELSRLVELAARACAESPVCRDYTRAEIEIALAELLAGYGVYRTYLGEDDDLPHDEDRARIATAHAAALAANPELDIDLLRFLSAALGFELSASTHAFARVAQQLTGAVIAKGDEDTLAYRQVHLLARCDVGCDVGVAVIDPDEAHRRLAAGRPRSLLATSTHDTKRGEDVRARLCALSELPEAWATAIARWRSRADAGWGDVEPDRPFEYAMWQTLVAAWPLPLARAQAWAEKATREARRRTSWRAPDAAYEAARDRWLAGIYADARLMEDVARFAADLAVPGDRNALAQLLIKLTAPGVPDLYQGTELCDDNLVDPDNRRPVDLAARARKLHELGRATVAQVAAVRDLGAAKLWLIRRALGRPRAQGAYEPLRALGPNAARVFAFRCRDAITVVPRLAARADGWDDTVLELPPGAWRDLGDTVHAGLVGAGSLFRDFPVALLVRVDD